MRVLIACEYSGVVREAFRAKGHEAWSCDLLPAEDGSRYHVQGDVLALLSCAYSKMPHTWDLMIAHPPCTYLCNSGVHWLHPRGQTNTEQKRVNQRWNEMEKARAFFMALWDQPIPKIVVENPVPHKYGKLPPYTQTIQPYQFGDDASKRTCLWVKGLEPLSIPPDSQWVPPRIVDGRKRWSNQTDGGQNKLGPSEDRAKLRSKTYQGIANALAEQYG